MSESSLNTVPDLPSPLMAAPRTPDPWRDIVGALLSRIGEARALGAIRVRVLDRPGEAGVPAERDFLVWQAADAVPPEDAPAPLSRTVMVTGRIWGRVEFTARDPGRVWEPRDIAEAEALAGLIATGAGSDGARPIARLLDALPVPALIVDLHGRVRHANAAAILLTGQPAGGLAGQPLDSLLDATPAPGLTPATLRRSDGTTLPVLIRTGRLEREDLTILCLSVRAGGDLDVDALLPLAFRDSVTGLPNRHHLMRGLASGNTVIAIHVLDRIAPLTGVPEEGPPLPLLIADQVTEALGSHPHLLIRSSESGLAIITDADTDTALALARAVRVPFKGPLRIGERRLPVQISIGIAQGERPLPQLLQDAEFACHPERAGAIHRFETALRTRLEERQLLEADLRAALRRNDPGLSIAFQPTVALASGLLVGFEVLARWQHPTRGPISPAVFVPLAENTGLMIALGTRVLDLAARTVQRWNEQRAARGLAPVFVSANLSSHQLVDPDLLGILGNIVSRTRVGPGHLRLELTEGTLMARPAQTATTLGAVSRLGIGLSIDDFGHGPSSLGHLHRFGVDALKIDRQFISGITRSEREKAVVAAMIGMARQLGLEPVAEGIESPTVAATLVEMGCALGQGFLFGRPMPMEAAEALILPPA